MLLLGHGLIPGSENALKAYLQEKLSEWLINSYKLGGLFLFADREAKTTAPKEASRFHRQHSLAKLIRLALKSSENYGQLRSQGITIRITIDMLIATFCIENNHVVLHSDRDSDHLAQYMGLQVF